MSKQEIDGLRGKKVDRVAKDIRLPANCMPTIPSLASRVLRPYTNTKALALSLELIWRGGLLLEWFGNLLPRQEISSLSGYNRCMFSVKVAAVQVLGTQTSKRQLGAVERESVLVGGMELGSCIRTIVTYQFVFPCHKYVLTHSGLGTCLNKGSHDFQIHIYMNGSKR